MNFIQQLMSTSNTPKQKRKKVDRSASNAAQRANTDGRYRLFLEGVVLSTPDLAKKMGFTAAGIMSSLLDLEARGVVKRMGLGEKKGPGKKPVLWTWNKEKQNG